MVESRPSATDDPSQGEPDPPVESPVESPADPPVESPAALRVGIESEAERLFRIYDRSGTPISFARYAELRAAGEQDQSDAYFRVAETQVGPYWVSTVWLGIDHRHGFGVPDHLAAVPGAERPPLIFETMVFADDGSAATDLGPEVGLWRYASEKEALVGHEEIVTLVRATLQEEPPTA